MSKTIKNKILYVMSDIETSDVAANSNSDLETYAWLTGFKIAGLYDSVSKTFDKTYKSELSYYYGENSIKKYERLIYDFILLLSCQIVKHF